MKVLTDLITALQAGPEFEQIMKAVETVGFPIVVVVLLLLIVVAPLILLTRTVSSGLGPQISSAVTLFSGTLNSMGIRQEESADRVAAALGEHTKAIQELGHLVAAMNESIRIQLTMTSQQMSQQAALTQKVADATAGPPVTGTLKPVEGGT